MTNTRTFHCIAKVAHEKMPDRYKRYTYSVGYRFTAIEDSTYIINIDVDTNGLTKAQLIALPGILRDIAGAMGWEYQVHKYGDGNIYNDWYKEDYWRFLAWTKDSASGYNSPDIEGEPELHEEPLNAELAAVWQIMHIEYGSDYCAGIKKEVVG